MAQPESGKKEKSKKKRSRVSKPVTDHYKLIRLFCYTAVVVMAVFTLAVVLAFGHYRLYPGRVERDSIISPDRSSDYIEEGRDRRRS